jgi:hypothetical protein
MIEKIQAGPKFRDDVRRLLDRPTTSSRAEHFRLMDLPTELRLMIAEYALSYEEGLVWRWKSTAQGKRVGCFKDKATHINGLNIYRSKPTTRLALCRRLHQETADLWARSTTVYFDTSMSSGTNTRPEKVRLAVDAFASLMRHAAGSRKTPLKVVLDGTLFGMTVGALQKLSETLQYVPHLDVRVVDGAFKMSGLERCDAWQFAHFMGFLGEDIRRCEAWCEARGLKRGWKTFPCEIGEKSVECLRKYLEGAKLESALEFLENGM